MEFAASLDTAAKVITVGSCALTLVVIVAYARGIAKAKGEVWGVIMRLVIIIVMISSVALSYWYSAIGYETRGKTLYIKKHNETIKLNYLQMTDVRRVPDAQMTDLTRTFGVGGLFGYTGHYHNTAIGNMTFCATQKKNWVVVYTTNGDVFILTPNEPDKFVKEVNDIIAPNN